MLGGIPRECDLAWHGLQQLEEPPVLEDGHLP